MKSSSRQLELFGEPEQFRARRLQVFNWGTFDGLHDIPISERGFLFVGRSGSGKTTLLDAISALIVRPQWIDFNAAAREAAHRGRDRHWATYVRGAWSEQKDDATGEIATRFLRPKTTWSALALTFQAAHDRVVVLVGLFWLRGRASGTGDVHRHYIILQRPFDLEELRDFNLDLRRLKQKLAEGAFFDHFNPYCERFRRLLRIESEMALRLLHKTQSAKSLGDLNTFLREFMLDTPRTFAVAETLVSEFAELNDAHQAVVTAREQVRTLAPAREKHERLQTVLNEQSALEALRQGVDAYRDQIRIELLEARIKDLGVKVEGLTGEMKQKEAAADNHRRTMLDLQEQHRQLGGDRIERLAAEKKEREGERSRRMAKREQARRACERLEWGVPDGPAALSALLDGARRELEAREAQSGRIQSQRDALAVARNDADRAFKEAVAEVASLERQPSNIPGHMLELRRKIASALAFGEEVLPFVGELIEVRPEEAPWRGAIERVMHGFALSILVEDRHYPAVSACVNGMHLGNRLVYYRIAGINPALSLAVSIDSLAGKLKLKEGPYQKWLKAELNHRFNYTCVDSMGAFKKHDRALTREGLVRHGKAHHEKDDRHAIDDRRHWVLGFDNREKLALYQKQAQELAARIESLRGEMEALRTAENQRAQRCLDCQTLVNLQWEEIDIAPLVERIAAIEKQLDEIRQGNLALRQIMERIDAARKHLTNAETALQEVKVDIREVEKEIGARGAELRKLLDLFSGRALAPEQQAGLGKRFGGLRERSSLENIDTHTKLVERQLNEEIKHLTTEGNQLEKDIEKLFGIFIATWRAESDGLDATLASAADFLAKLRRLEVDGLPRHERRFFDLLKDQSHQNLASLNTHLRQARNEIRERMELVNEGLRQAEFNRGTYLCIDVGDRQLPDVQAFKREIHEALSHAWTDEREMAERRFTILRHLVERLGDQDPHRRRWRETVLDVRQHVEFIARELDANGGEVEVYRGGAGKSGGQRQKLATTCLAAALRYQLGGTDAHAPSYAAVILDEAFDKSDNEFTALAMNIFNSFGFQMIIATPLKSVMTLEPFIGGACFVDIDDQHRSGVLMIEYDTNRHRLNLPEQAHDTAPLAVS